MSAEESDAKDRNVWRSPVGKAKISYDLYGQESRSGSKHRSSEHRSSEDIAEEIRREKDRQRREKEHKRERDRERSRRGFIFGEVERPTPHTHSRQLICLAT
uniref:Uncharacterized protein n=1 Tax=Timema shepardi TaxID=629360 RepID=A0A7R9AUB8_TIMSH|nr:unnamed protein product [Timema shepardi]